MSSDKCRPWVCEQRRIIRFSLTGADSNYGSPRRDPRAAPPSKKRSSLSRVGRENCRNSNASDRFGQAACHPHASPGQVCHLVGRLRRAGRCINERRTEGRGTLRRPGRQGEAVHDISSNRPGGSSIESLKKRLCLPQVGGLEPFGEPVINRLQHCACVGDTDMSPGRRSGHARGGAQFQG